MDDFGCPPPPPTQIVDSTLYFNGSSYLVNETISAAIANSPWTIDFWATPSDTARDRFFFSTFNANYGTAGMVTKGWVHMNWHSGNIDYGSYGDDHDLNLGLAPNVRHHFALVYDGIEKFVFVDGVLKGSYAENIKLGGKFFIGVAPASDIGTFTGTIDHFRIFKGVALWTQDFTPPAESDYPDSNPSTTSNTIQSGSSGSNIDYIIGSNVSTVEGGFWRGIINDTPVLKLRHGDYEYNFQYDSLTRVSDNNTAAATVTPDTYVLGTASVSSEGGVWYEVNDNVPTLKLHAGNYNYGFKYDSITYKGDNSHLAAYLPFNVSATADACGNVWTVTGSPQIIDSKLYLSSSSYLTNTTIADSIGSLPWTADCWFSCGDTNNTSLLQRFQLSGGNTSHSMVSSCISGNIFMIHLGDANLVSNVAVTANTRYHCALTYDGTTLRMFINGALIVQNELAIQLGGSSYIGWPSADITIDHLRVFKGQALWTSNFTPPTTADYA